MYIDVVCGKRGSGKILIEKVISIADSKKLDVGLSALPTVITYYLRYGFQYRETCDNDVNVFVPSDAEVELIKRAKLTT